mmetsp:Transcript_11194/g.33573  ORF Transcript_11194/g.33573 Transcript_11194/m.33573 type:complete len:301 (+) Transcript_11194:1425-2327(+)
MADGVTDGHVLHAHEGADVACLHLVHPHLGEVVVDIQLRHLACARLHLVWPADDNLLALPDAARCDAADANAPLVVVEVKIGDEHLQRGLQPHRGRCHLPHDALEQRLQAVCQGIRLVTRHPVGTRGVNDGEVALLVVGTQVHKQIESGVNNIIGPGSGAVDLVDHNHNTLVQLQRLAQDKSSLRHRTLHRVHQQQHAVAHVEHTLHLPTKVSVTWGVDDVDLAALVSDGSVFGKDGDTTLPLQVVAVHHTLACDLIVPENVGLLKHGIHHGCFAVINVSNNRDVPDALPGHQRDLCVNV